MSETMQHFLEFYKPSDKVLEFDALESITVVLRILDTSLKQMDAKIVCECVERVLLKGIRNEWMQVWMNLLRNSLNVAKAREIKAPTITIRIQHDSIAFEDDCGGIEPEVLEQILEGTQGGLGIKMSYDITAKYHKKLNITNTKNGACFEVV